MPSHDHTSFWKRILQWRELVTPRFLSRDLQHGLLLAANTLPLSILLASLAGAPASSGIIGAGVGSLICALLGGTRAALSGPGIVGALVSSSVISRHGLEGLGVVVAAAGLLQLMSGALRLGRFARLLPLSLLRACVTGSGVALLLWHLTQSLGSAPLSSPALGVAAGAALLGLAGVRYRRFPGALLALVAVVPLAHVLGLELPMVAERATFPVPQLPSFEAQGIASLLHGAFTLWGAMTLSTVINTAALEQVHADAGAPVRTDADLELIGNGVATLAVAFLHGLPTTQLVARSALGVRLGVESTRPALIQALVVAGVGLAAWPVLHLIPLAALTGSAVTIALPLLDPRPLAALRRVSRLEFGVSIATIATMVLGGVETGLFVGLALAFGLAAARMARTRALVHRSRDPAAPHQISFSGPITFLAALELERLKRALDQLETGPGLVVDLRSAMDLDGTGAMALLSTLDAWRARGGKVALLGPSQKVRERLERADEAPRPLPQGELAPGALKHAFAPNDRALEAILGKPTARLARPQLLAGLARFREEKRGHYDSLFSQLADGQHPHTLFVTCADSRVDPALLMGSHPGDLFVVRSIGALIPPAGTELMPQEGAGVEYALGVLGVRTIVVCGHSKCGAISALRSGKVPDELPTLKTWSRHASSVGGEVQGFANADEATRAVTVRQLENLLTHPLVREKHAAGELQLHAWFYDLGTVELTEWDPARGAFVALDSESESDLSKAS